MVRIKFILDYHVFFRGITVLALTGMFHHYDYDVEDLVNLLIVTVNLSLIMNFTK